MVTVAGGTWALSDRLLFQPQVGGLIQVIVDLNGPEAVEFCAADGKVIEVEIQTAYGAFSVLSYPGMSRFGRRARS